VALRLGLSHVSQRWPGSLALTEVGASAGLNLRFDRYRYRVGGQETAPGPASPVLISCELRGGAPAGQVPGQVLGPAPQITSRLGIDRQPVALADPGERAWLEAFIWPEDVDGLATLRGTRSPTPPGCWPGCPAASRSWSSPPRCSATSAPAPGPP
jgi:hypothetical protein